MNRWEPTGHFAITLGSLLIGMAIGAAIGAIIGFGSAAYNDYREDNTWFNGDWTDYVGKTLGGAVAGAGIGLAGTLGGWFRGSYGCWRIINCFLELQSVVVLLYQ